jgi:SAM-dependent methyltransferase
VFRATGGHVPLGDATIDIVTAFDTIEHIPEEGAAIAECFRILKPGGLFFVSVPAYQFLFTHQDRVVHHQRRYTCRGLSRRLRAGGFEVVRASYINFLLFPIILPIVLLVKAKQMIKRPTDEDARSNVSVPVPRWVNRCLAGIFGFERHVLARVSMPAGHSLVAIARKPGTAG